MLSNNVNVSGQEISEHFAKFFKKKVEDIVTEMNVDNNVYNGHRKITAYELMFMSRSEIIESVKFLKIKKQ
jgi:hypothetical protein